MLLTASSDKFLSDSKRAYSYEDDTEIDEHSRTATISEPLKPWAMEGDVLRIKEEYEAAGYPAKRLGVSWENLTVKGKASGAVLHDTVLSIFNLPEKIKTGRRPTQEQVILDDNFGCVRPGQVLLVLARPGGGSTTLLKVLANAREGYSSIEGDVWYGNMDHKQAREFRGEIVMNGEEEIFYPHMTVGQTIEFATALKTPAHASKDKASRIDHREKTIDFLLRSMAISHTKDTTVGNEYIRGVSGGERRRLSIIETLATRAAVVCWDNSTRGLDASTALNWAQAVRTITDALGLASIMTLYQAGNGIYDLVDDVMVLHKGLTIYYGPRMSARGFFEGLGFEYVDGANIADMLTGVTVPAERKIAPGYEHRFPRTATEIRKAYLAHGIYEEMRKRQDYARSDEAAQNTQQFIEAVKLARDPSLPKHSVYSVGYLRQIQVLARQQFRQILGDKLLLYFRQGNTVIQALVMGSLFFQVSDDSVGLFTRGGAIFFSTVYHTLFALQEVEVSFQGRAVLAKQKAFAFFHPVNYVIAQLMGDVPVIFTQVTLFSVILYFMTGLLLEPGAFFTYLAIVFSTTMCATALFRMIGTAFSNFTNASKAGGLTIIILFTYSGYIIHKPSMHPWFEWMFWIDPLAYAVEAMMATELSDRTFACGGTNLVPFGPEYAGQPAGCSGVPGSIGASVEGTAYLSYLSFSKSHVWRNFGVIWAFWALFVTITAILMTYTVGGGSSGANLEFARNEKTLAAVTAVNTNDSEKQLDLEDTMPSKEESVQTNKNAKFIKNTAIFTWENLTYTVKTAEGDRVLLNNVNGFVKPGTLGALMGSSGAGKTTLLDVLAQRKTEGEISGKIHVDGRPLPLAFQRSAGYCEQLDVHEPLATVREALEFSARLRQSRDTPHANKMAYVQTVIDLLEMRDIEDALVGTVGNGLSVEQRKRLTIGVELVAKPSILLFLDEPTSGLDSQSAFAIVKFLRKLADVGQAILVTIHQPSASLFYEFDNLLLLARGGNTVYNGPIGSHAVDVRRYFQEAGAPCPPGRNPAEHMIDVVSGELSQKQDWPQTWLNSPQAAAIQEELRSLENDAASRPVSYDETAAEFAATLWEQCKVVNKRNSISLYRDTDYVTNKAALHILSALFNGFTFWMIGDGALDLQNKVFSVFSFVFVAPGVIAQVQPLFIARRDIFEAREKKAKIYSWKAFTFGLIVSEFPYLLLCAVLYYCCWYFTCGFPSTASRAGPVFLEVLMYEFIYTGIGQFIASYAPTATIASAFTPLILGTLLSFSGVFVPYSAMQDFWKYWLYYLDVFRYIINSILWFVLWDQPVVCRADELTNFDPPQGQTCQSYLNTYLTQYNPGANLINPEATSGCQVCPYSSGTNYLATININAATTGWRDIGITGIFVISSYAIVFLMMKLRTKATKKAD